MPLCHLRVLIPNFCVSAPISVAAQQLCNPSPKVAELALYPFHSSITYSRHLRRNYSLCKPVKGDRQCIGAFRCALPGVYVPGVVPHLSTAQDELKGDKHQKTPTMNQVQRRREIAARVSAKLSVARCCSTLQDAK